MKLEEINKIFRRYEFIKQKDYVETTYEDPIIVKTKEKEMSFIEFVGYLPGKILGTENKITELRHPLMPQVKRFVNIYSSYGTIIFNEEQIGLYYLTTINNAFPDLSFDGELLDDYDKEVRLVKRLFNEEMKLSVDTFLQTGTTSSYYESLKIHKDLYIHLMQGKFIEDYHAKIPRVNPFQDLFSKRMIAEYNWLVKNVKPQIRN